MISQWLCQSNICHCIFKLLRVIMHYLSTLIQTIQLCDLGNLGNFWAYIYGQLSVYLIDWLIEIKHVLATNQHFPGNSDPFSIKPTVVPVEISPKKCYQYFMGLLLKFGQVRWFWRYWKMEILKRNFSWTGRNRDFFIHTWNGGERV